MLLAGVLQELMRRAGLAPDVVEDVVSGCVDQVGEQAATIGRNALLAGGFPYTIPATTIDRQCGSSQQAVHFAANLIQSGVCDVTIGCGVESMNRVPILSSFANGPGFPAPPELYEQYAIVPQGVAADMIAKQWGIRREDADRFGYESHMKAARAREEGHFEREIMPVKVSLEGVEVQFERDEGIRPDTTPEKLAALTPSSCEDGIHTAGNSLQGSAG